MPNRMLRLQQVLGWLEPIAHSSTYLGKRSNLTGYFEKRLFADFIFNHISSGLIFWLLEFVSDEINSWLHPFWMIPI